MVKRFRANIRGNVQGVFYRATAREQATALNIRGFVRNLPDGCVELTAEGEESDLNALLRWCHHGPPGARVDDVEVQWSEAEGDTNDFSIRYSG